MKKKLGENIRQREREQTELPQVQSEQKREQHPGSKDDEDDGNDDDQNKDESAEELALIYIFDIEANASFLLERFLLRVCEISSILEQFALSSRDRFQRNTQ